MQIEKQRNCPKSIIWLIGFKLSHLAGTADLCHTLTAGCLSCGMIWEGSWVDRKMHLCHLCTYELFISLYSISLCIPCILFPCVSLYVFGDALIHSARYFVSVRVSVVASCSFICPQLSSYIAGLPVYLPSCLPVDISAYLSTYLSSTYL